LAQKAEIILADEPTAALDPAASYSIAELIVDIASSQQMTLISILHDMALLPVLSDRVIGIRSGRVIFDQGSETLSNEILRGFYDERAVIRYSH
jgi:phosphonate transport system ATP-binding protein